MDYLIGAAIGGIVVNTIWWIAYIRDRQHWGEFADERYADGYRERGREGFDGEYERGYQGGYLQGFRAGRAGGAPIEPLPHLKLRKQ